VIDWLTDPPIDRFDWYVLRWLTLWSLAWFRYYGTLTKTLHWQSVGCRFKFQPRYKKWFTYLYQAPLELIPHITINVLYLIWFKMLLVYHWLQSAHCECFSELLAHTSGLTSKLLDIFEQFGGSCSGDFVAQFNALALDEASEAARALELHSCVSSQCCSYFQLKDQLREGSLTFKQSSSYGLFWCFHYSFGYCYFLVVHLDYSHLVTTSKLIHFN